MTIIIPEPDKAVGDSGFTGDINSAYSALDVLATYNVLNSAYAGGADPSGSNDSTAAFQAVLDAIANSASGGRMYIPGGQYKIEGELTYSASGGLMIEGDSAQASQVRLANSSPGTYLSVTMSGAFGDFDGVEGTFLLANVGFYNDVYVGSFTAENVAVYLNDINHAAVHACGWYQGSASQRVSQALVMNACNEVVVDTAHIIAAVNGIVMSGYNQVNVLQDVSIWTPSGTGVATAACVLYQGQCLGTNARHLVLHDGDRGILWTQDSAGKQPHIFVGLDVEFNNHTIVAAEFDYGVHLYLLNSVFSGSAVTSLSVPGLLLGDSYQGDVLLEGCEFIGQSGPSIQADGGTGITLSGCSFGSTGTYKANLDTDEVYIGAAVSSVTITGCQFNVRAQLGMGATNPPRSAVYAAAGASGITLAGCKGAASGYGTAPVVDLAGAVMKTGCTGLGYPDSRSGGGATVTSASAMQSLGTSIIIPAWDMIPGKAYRYTAWGYGTQATGTAAGLSVRGNVAGNSLGTFAVAGGPAAGSSFFWKYELLIRCTGTGPSGTAGLVASDTFTWAASTEAHGTAAVFTTFDTTADSAVVLTAEWSTATGSPTITCVATLLEALQNWPAS